MPLHLEIVTAERAVLAEDDVDQVVAPGADGQLTILPRHASLITLLQPGELRIRRRGEERVFAVSGGFMEVHHSRVPKESMRTAAFIIAINKVALTYEQLGVFP